jgi:hypothetical protein
MNSKEKAILDSIKHLEDAIIKGKEYLESGKHADWHGFRSLFVDKVRDGKILPPHKDWIRNVFLPSSERALKKAQEQLHRLTLKLDSQKLSLIIVRYVHRSGGKTSLKYNS